MLLLTTRALLVSAVGGRQNPLVRYERCSTEAATLADKL